MNPSAALLAACLALGAPASGGEPELRRELAQAQAALQGPQAKDEPAAGLPLSEIHARIAFWEPLARLQAGMAERHPEAPAVLARERALREEVQRIEALARVRLAALHAARNEKSYALRQYAVAGAVGVLGAAGIELDKDALDAVIDNAARRRGVSAVEARGAGPGRASDLVPAVPRPPQAASPVPAPEGGLGLAAGIVYTGPEEIVDYAFWGLRERRGPHPGPAVLAQALKKLAEIPEGWEILSEVQRLRAERGPAVIAEMIGAQEREIAQLRRSIERHEPLPAYADRVRYDREQLARAESRLDALRRTGRVEVCVDFNQPGTGGQMRPIFVATPEGACIPVSLGYRLLEDGNPVRAVDKVLAHELRHVADASFLEGHWEALRLGLQLPENRAFLSGAVALAQQEPLMQGEPPSAVLQQMRESELARLDRDPARVRLDLFERGYFWNATAADLEDPESGMRARLVQLFETVEFASRRNAAWHRLAGIFGFQGVYPIEAAYADARKAAPRDLYRRQELFVEAALKTSDIADWITRARAAGQTLRHPPDERSQAWAERVRQMEAAYWEKLAAFHEARSRP